MRRYSFFILCFSLCLLHAMAAGTGKLRGMVSDAHTGEPISGVIVKAKGSFVTTDREGRFELPLKAETDSIIFRCMGYETSVMPLSGNFLEVRLNQKATQLKDVVVVAPDIYARGDTLVFNVSRYANTKDNAIIDVIKRLPGIKVKEDGTIEYQGKPINKFYLDGNDFIGGQYALAANNISHKDVKSVEVMEHHQPVKALEGIEFPEEAGINLKLKDDARSRWVGVANAAAGVQPFLYDGSVFTMLIAPKIQNMFTLKADNTGWNPANEIRDHDLDIMFSTDYAYSFFPEYISADMTVAPLSEKRTRDNLSWLANSITAWKSGDTSMRLKLNYMGDRLDYNSGTVTDYFSAQIPAFIQNSDQRKRVHDLSAQFYSETNKKGYYLKDKLTLSGIMDKSNSAITGSFDITQRVNRKNFMAVNNLKLVKRNNKQLFNLSSRNSFGYRPDRLTVSGSADALQSLATVDFRSTTETSIGKLTRFWKFYMNAMLDLNYHRMRNTLDGMGDFDNEGAHNAFLSSFSVSPQVDFDRNGWRMSLKLPLKWQHYSVNGQHDYLNTAPYFNIWRQVSSKSELSGSVSFNLSSPQPFLNINVPILSDYRNLFIAENPDKYTRGVASSLSYRYRNPMKSLFFNLSANYGYSASALMANQLFIDDFIISTYTDRLHHRETWQFKGGVSKGLGHSKMVIGLETDASLSSASSMRDNAVIPYSQVRAGIRPYFKGSILRWLSVNYEAKYEFSKLSINEERNNYHAFQQNLFVTVFPNDRLNFTFGAEHYLNRFPEGNTANLVLLDASAVWIVSHKIRLSLTANNLLNKRCYEYVNYGTLSRSEHKFNIRQRSILASIQYRF